MSYADGVAALHTIYEFRSGWRVSENNLAEDRQYADLKGVTS